MYHSPSQLLGTNQLGVNKKTYVPPIFPGARRIADGVYACVCVCVCVCVYVCVCVCVCVYVCVSLKNECSPDTRQAS